MKWIRIKSFKDVKLYIRTKKDNIFINITYLLYKKIVFSSLIRIFVYSYIGPNSD